MVFFCCLVKRDNEKGQMKGDDFDNDWNVFNTLKIYNEDKKAIT